MKSIIDDGFNAEFVFDAEFDGMLEIPKIKEFKGEIPTKLIPFSKRKQSENGEEYLIFYEHDKTFGDVLRNPDKYLDEFNKFKGIVTVDASLYRDMPLTAQIANVYRSRAIGYYFQKHGINVICNCRWSDERSYTNCVLPEKFAFLGIPKNSVVSVGSYGCIQGKENKKYFIEGFREMIKELQPKVVIIYGSIPKQIIEEFGNKVQLIQFDDWTTTKRGEKYGHRKSK
jgi:glycosyltransferase involved in cell wall biosynthesis